MTPLETLVAGVTDPTVPDYSVATLVDGKVEVAAQGGPPSRLFQACSISKPVAALAALVLVARGRLKLDEDVNARLTGWKLPAPTDWPARVTLRQLLSHTGALTVEAFPGYRHGATLPTLRQILDGAPPAISSAVRITALPGLVHRYSGGGYTLLQHLLQEVTGQEFGRLVTELVFKPAGMFAAEYGEPVDETAATGLSGGKPVPGGWNVYPELAAAGLWCTPTDLVRFAAAVQAAVAGEKGAILPQPLAVEFTTEQVPGWGLGLELGGTGKGRRFGHSGSNEGYRCELSATLAPGPAVAVMTASDQGTSVIKRLLPGLHKLVNWPNPPTVFPVGRALASTSDMAQLNLLYGGDYQIPGGPRLLLAGEGWRWALTVPGQPPLPLEVKSHTLVAAPALRVDIEFQLDSGGRATGLTIVQDGGRIFAKRV